MAASREHWSGRLGFTLAAIGSAVGLGNMWRFSYMAAENGGAAFVVLYVVMTLVVGLPVMLAELTLGRGAGKSPIQAIAHYGGERWKPLGGLFVLTGFVILAYYSVIAGWTFRYSIESIANGFPMDAGDHFSRIASGWPALGWHLAFMALTTAVVSGGVRSGIERTSLLLMPLLGLIVLGLAIYASTLDGAAAGYAYYFQTDFAAIWNTAVLRDAAGQAFFSLSLGMGAILTYASYLDRNTDLPAESITIAISDFAVAFLAGLVVFPLLFALGLQDDVGASTVGALFITIPKAFAELGTAGTVIGVAFFLALLVGGLTSAISLLEVVVSSVIDATGTTRRRAAVLCGGAIALLGIPAAFSLDVLGLMDQIGGNLFLIIGGLALSIFVGWVMPDALEEAGASSRLGFLLFGWRVLLRFAVPAILAFVLWFTIGDTWSLIADTIGG
jgi:neurotransmitter:Na+ symporter, NSS family